MAIEIVLTKRIQNIIVGALKSEQVHKELAERLSPFMHEPSGKKESKEYRKKASIPFSIVKQLWECLRDETADSGSRVYLHEMITGSEVYVEPLTFPEKIKKTGILGKIGRILTVRATPHYPASRDFFLSPELVTRLKRLKAEQEKADYAQMVSSVDRQWNQSASMQFGHEVRSGSKQLASIINFLLSLLGTFAFGYMASQYAFPSIAMRVIIGILLALIVAIAELYFMARVEI